MKKKVSGNLGAIKRENVQVSGAQKGVEYAKVQDII